MNLPEFPPPPGCREPPAWTGCGFRTGNTTTRILSYEPGDSGWTEELTAFHEDVDDENHYINVASREHAVSRVERWIASRNPVIIDIGCSSGYTLKLLRARLPEATILGADFIRGPLEKLSESFPDLPLLHFDLRHCPLPDGSFDGVILLNVLEHVKEDSAALRQIARILKPGGIAAIEVPAGPGLYDVYDKQLLHFRRYRMRDFVNRVRSAGLEAVERSHLGCLLYPAFWIVKKRNQRHLNAPPDVQKGIVTGNMRQARHNALMNLLMRGESQLRHLVYLPFGIRCLVTCRKP
jgi:SAM-dependent methyltransferase